MLAAGALEKYPSPLTDRLFYNIIRERRSEDGHENRKPLQDLPRQGRAARAGIEGRQLHPARYGHGVPAGPFGQREEHAFAHFKRTGEL